MQPKRHKSKPKPIKSCTECRRRKQKCEPRKDGPCENCLRRYPPVECVGGEGFIARKNEARTIDSKPKLVPLRASPTPKPASHVKRISFVHEKKHNGKKLPQGNPKLLGGVGGTLTALTSANIPIEATPQNTELFYIYHQALAPLMASIDGRDVPKEFGTIVMPWMMQSPLVPEIAVLTGAGYRAIIRGADVSKDPETIAIRVRVLAHISEFLQQDFNKIYMQAIQTVAHLVMLEWYWGDHVTLWAHMRGLQQMIALRGGIGKLPHLFLRQLVMLGDFELACFFERDLYLHLPTESHTIPMPETYPYAYQSPVFTHGPSFHEIRCSLELSPATASILDDVRYLSTSILSLSSSPSLSKDQYVKLSNTIKSHASRIHDKITKMPILIPLPTSPVEDLVFETIRLTSQAYISCLSSCTPFSQAFSPPQRKMLYDTLLRVSLSAWKKIPGIYLWVLLVVCPGSGQDEAFGRLLRRNISVTAIFVVFQDLGLAMGCLEGFWGVQRWIQRVIDMEMEMEIEEDVDAEGESVDGD